MDLTTSYLGIRLKNPIVASSSPLWESVSNIRALEDSGVSAVVLPSIFEEQLQMEGQYLDRDLARGTESFGEALSYFPVLRNYNLGPDGYLELIRKAKSAVSIPVIASLNGTSRGGWIRYARDAQHAGCDAIELNLYSLVTDPTRTSVQVEKRLLRSGSRTEEFAPRSRGRQTLPFLDSSGKSRRAARRGRCECARAFQPLLSA